MPRIIKDISKPSVLKEREEKGIEADVNNAEQAIENARAVQQNEQREQGRPLSHGEAARTQLSALNRLYILEGTNPVACSDVARWNEFVSNPDNVIVRQSRSGDLFISTVFLGRNHNFIGVGMPILFETMVWDHGVIDPLHTMRYTTWDQAVAGHDLMVARFRRRF